ncbi:MAG: biotin/lipoyl-binding protein [Mogibacterium sp.]|nr:biotin/lipoyl-binding protein [Mogibacterium sp.]
MSRYRIKMNGKVYEMEIELIEEDNEKVLKKAPENEHKSVSNTNNGIFREKPAEKQDNYVMTSNSNTVTSPMPGIVLQICVKTGQEVSDGDVILVLETMKMENEICASKNGTIKAIHVKEGQSISVDAPLFELEG